MLPASTVYWLPVKKVPRNEGELLLRSGDSGGMGTGAGGNGDVGTDRAEPTL